jgi:hypothetical protein
MPPRSRPLSPAEAIYVIERLIADRRITAAQVATIQAEREVEIQQLEERLAMLRGDGKRGRPGRGRAVSASKLSPETQASQRLQGIYLNLIRRVPEAERGRFKQMAQTKGREAAVKALRSFLAR